MAVAEVLLVVTAGAAASSVATAVRTLWGGRRPERTPLEQASQTITLDADPKTAALVQEVMRAVEASKPSALATWFQNFIWFLLGSSVSIFTDQIKRFIGF